MDPGYLTLDDVVQQRRIQALLQEGWPTLSAEPLAVRFGELATHAGLSAPVSSRALAVYAPGRIEIVGKHTDYAGGQSLTCAVNRAFCMLAVPNTRPGLEMHDQFRGTSAFIPYDGNASTGENWPLYPATVVRRFVQNFGNPESGLTIVFSSDIPRAAGMSSSSAFVVGIWLCLAGLNPIDALPAFSDNLHGPEDLASYMGCIENGAPFRGLVGNDGVGTQGGAQDHTAILFSRAGEVGYFGYKPLSRLGRIRFPSDLTFVIASSGVNAHKASGAKVDYNRAVRLADRCAEIWSRGTGSETANLEQVVSSGEFSQSEFDRLVRKAEPDSATQEELMKRMRQFVAETREIIPGVVSALAAGAYDRLDSFITRSHRLADECLENQVPETRFLVESALDVGALAASGFGAGFGGSVYALAPTADADRVLRDWMAAYGQQFGHRLRQACFFTDSAGPGAFVLGADQKRLSLEPGL